MVEASTGPASRFAGPRLSGGRMPAVSMISNAVVMADVDRDRDLDLVFAVGMYFPNSDDQDRIYVNDGTGVFTDETATRMPVDQDDTQAVAARASSASRSMPRRFSCNRLPPA
jgi:hypothetical protein